MWSVTVKMSGKTTEKTIEKTIETLSRYVVQLGTYNKALKHPSKQKTIQTLSEYVAPHLGPNNTHSLETFLKTENYIDTVRIRGTAIGTIQYTHTAFKLPSKRNTQHAGTHVHTHAILQATLQLYYSYNKHAIL